MKEQDRKRSKAGVSPAQRGFELARIQSRPRNAGPAFALIASALSCWLASAAEPGPSPSAPPDYDAFKLVNERNIFNQNRSQDGQKSAPRPRERRTESFDLVGILEGEKGALAFFESSSEAYNKQARVSEKVGDLTVAEISPSQVKLEADGKSLEMQVGTRLQRQDEGEWRFGEFIPTTSDVPARSQLLAQFMNAGRRGRGGGRGGQQAFGGRGGGTQQNGFGGQQGGFNSQNGNVQPNGLGDQQGQRGRRGRFDDGSGTGGDTTGGFGGGRGGGRGRGGNRNSGESGTDASGGTAQPQTRTPASTMTTTPSTGESEAEILRRLQQRREQETTQP